MSSSIISNNSNSGVSRETNDPLALENVSVELNGTVALRGVGMEIGAAARLGVLGPSGAGKSTLARLLAGLVAPSSGSVTFRGRPLWPRVPGSWSAHDYRDQVVLIPQDGGLFANLRLVGNFALLYGGRLSRRENKAQWIAVVKRLGLSADLLERYPNEVSGGQRQRMAIARALLKKPAITILDEPTANLDAAAIELVIQTLEVGFQDRALVIISHDLAFLSKFCTSFVLLCGGEVALSGTRDLFVSDKLPNALRAFALP